jgi:hypothetical protein
MTLGVVGMAVAKARQTNLRPAFPASILSSSVATPASRRRSFQEADNGTDLAILK